MPGGYNTQVPLEAGLSPEKQREILLTQCIEEGWRLYVYQFGKLKGTSADYLQRELDRTTPLLQRLTLSWEKKLLLKARKWYLTDSRLKSETDARVAVMTTNGAYYQVALALDNEGSIPAGYKNIMEALKAQLPWNRTGLNQITIEQITIQDLGEALGYINSKLPK